MRAISTWVEIANHPIMVQGVKALYDRPLTGKGKVERCTVALLQTKLSSIKSIYTKEFYVYKHIWQKRSMHFK